MARCRSNSSVHDENQQPQPPPLMGGDGSHGPGVLVSTEQTRREENVDGETVTLQLQHPSSNDDNPILCSIVFNRRAIRASSALIRNLLDNSEDDEVLPPFSTEHIADELTLRRVVEFVTDVEPTIPKKQLTEDCFLEVDYDEDDGSEFFVVRKIRANDFCDSLQDLLRKCVAEDGHRGGIVKMLVSAHYLGCEKLKNATAAYLAFGIDTWCQAHAKMALFGEDMFGIDGDPLGSVPLAVLADIANLIVNDVAATKTLLGFSPKLFKSVAQVERIWENCNNQFKIANFDDPTCHICLAMEQRLECCPHGPLDVSAVFHGDMSSYLHHTRWSKLVDKLAVLVSKQSDLLVSWCGAAPLNLTAPNSVPLHVLVKASQLNPNGLTVVPPLPPGGVDAIADCWKDYYHFATHNATSISVELTPLEEDPEFLDTSQLVDILQHTTQLQSLHVRHEPNQPRQSKLKGELKAKDTLHKLLEFSMIRSISLEVPNVALLNILPTSLKSLGIRNMKAGEFTEQVGPAVHAGFRQKREIQELILDASDSPFEMIHAGLVCNCIDARYHLEKKVLRVYFCNVDPWYATNDTVAAHYCPHIEFYILEADSGSCKRVPTERLPNIDCWERADPPKFWSGCVPQKSEQILNE